MIPNRVNSLPYRYFTTEAPNWKIDGRSQSHIRSTRQPVFPLASGALMETKSELTAGKLPLSLCTQAVNSDFVQKRK
jgi:hypothetical protein